MSEAEDPMVTVLRRLAERAKAARDNPPPRPPDEDWRPSGLLLALGELVDDEECLEERDAWPDVPDRD